MLDPQRHPLRRGLTLPGAPAYREPVVRTERRFVGFRTRAGFVRPAGFLASTGRCPARVASVGRSGCVLERSSSRRLVGFSVSRSAFAIPRTTRCTRKSTRTWSLSSEAHLPAQQPSASQEARVPPADAYARRPVDPVLSPPQGPRQTGSLTRLVVLPASARMTRSRDFESTVRRGRRAPGGRVVAHLCLDTAVDDTAADGDGRHAAQLAPDVRVGFIVSKAVGNAVTRHRVARQLRHVLAAHLHQLAPGSRLVIRALPGCAESTSEAIDRDVTRALRRLLDAQRPAGMSA